MAFGKRPARSPADSGLPLGDRNLLASASSDPPLSRIAARPSARACCIAGIQRYSVLEDPEHPSLENPLAARRRHTFGCSFSCLKQSELS